MPLKPLELQILGLLQAGHRLTVRWNCGGDESFVYTEVDGVERDFDYNAPNDLASGMDQYLTELLELPDVGEFDMQGSGHIFLDGPAVVIDYQSEARTYWDDDDSWHEHLSDEQLADLGLTRPTPSADSEPPAEAANAAAKTSSEPEIDAEMSDEYSGRRVLFQAV